MKMFKIEIAHVEAVCSEDEYLDNTKALRNFALKSGLTLNRDYEVSETDDDNGVRNHVLLFTRPPEFDMGAFMKKLADHTGPCNTIYGEVEDE
jgi:hypothetical protein